MENGIEDEPALVAWMQDPVAPAANLEHRPGRWVAEAAWPSPLVTPTAFALGTGTLGEDDPAPGRATVGSVQTVGLEGGAWCADGKSADLPLDQRGEDGHSLTFDSAPLDEPLEILGIGEVRLHLASDRPLALVSARVNEVRADGSVLLVTRGQLNLAHRGSHADPQPLEPGREEDVVVTLDSIAHRFAAGSRLRLSLSPCYWPLAWPSPEPVTLTVGWGDGAALVLPVRAARAEGDGPAREPDPPAEPEAYETQTLVSGVGSRSIHRDLTVGRAELRFDWDLGGRRLLVPAGLTVEETAVARYAITEGDPLSAEVEIEVPFKLERGDEWKTSGRAWARMTCTRDAFLVTTTLDCYQGSSRVWARAWSFTFLRDHG